MSEHLDLSALDLILKNTINSIENCKEQIFDIAENARAECKKVEKELDKIKTETYNTIEAVDKSQTEERIARLYLVQVSNNLSNFSEEDIKKAYFNANDIQIRLAVLLEKEKQLRIKRNELEVSYKKLKETAEKAESFISKVSIAMNFLSTNLQNIWTTVDELQENQAFGMAVIQAQEEERHRIARGIHDGPAQNIANIILRAEYCEKLLVANPNLLEGELKELKSLSRDTLADVRKIIFDLRPMDLDDLGLVPAMKRYIDDLNLEQKVIIDFVSHSSPRRYIQAIEVAIFRIMQEALNNALKHSNCTNVKVIIQTDSKNIVLIIKDNGVGFDPKISPSKRGFGLKSMFEWSKILNGELKISSTENKGTIIAVRIPIEEESKDD